MSSHSVSDSTPKRLAGLVWRRARYFRLLLIGYFEGLDAERAIAWRAADSFALREFLGLVLPEAPPDHSTISRTRRLIDLETHQPVFTGILGTRTFSFRWHVRPNAVWRLGRVFVECPRCNNRATRLYVPTPKRVAGVPGS